MNQPDPPTKSQDRFQTDSAGSPAAESTDELKRILHEARALGAELWRYLSVRSDQVRLRARQFVVRIGLATALAVVGIVLATAGGWFLLNGMAGGFAAWLNSAWLGELLAGVTMLALIGLAGAWFWRTRETARLHRLQHKYQAPTAPADGVEDRERPS